MPPPAQHACEQQQPAAEWTLEASSASPGAALARTASGIERARRVDAERAARQSEDELAETDAELSRVAADIRQASSAAQSASGRETLLCDVTEMRNVTCWEPQSFGVEDVEGWRSALLSDGVCVIRKALDAQRRQQLLQLFWRDFEAACRQSGSSELHKVRRGDRASWVTPDELGRKSRHAPLHIAQSDFFWELRCEPAMAAVFAAVHNVAPSELCCSMDSYSLHMRGHPASGLRLHDDQAINLDIRSKVFSIQGAYNFFGVGQHDSGLVVVPRSHNSWAKRRSGDPEARHRGHFVMLQHSEPSFNTSYANARKLLLHPNSLVLWNSKLLHGTSPGTRERGATADGLPKLNRLTCFVAMLPAALRTPEVRAAKVQLYKQGGTTSHWACLADVHPMNASGAIPGRPVRAATSSKGKGMMKSNHAKQGGGVLGDGIPPERFALM
eukprot:SAG31_NODE_728_length_12522_cov_13.320534_12_plen_443_part_00